MKEQNEESPKEAQKRYITLTDLMVVAWKDKFLIAFFSIIFFFSSSIKKIVKRILFLKW